MISFFKIVLIKSDAGLNQNYIKDENLMKKMSDLRLQDMF